MNDPRRRAILLAGAVLACDALCRSALASNGAALPRVVVWKDPNCGCCNGWITHLRMAGFDVTARDSAAMAAIKQARGVPDTLQSCHTAVIDGYVVEGHVPAEDIKRLLTERPAAQGLAVP